MQAAPYQVHGPFPFVQKLGQPSYATCRYKHRLYQSLLSKSDRYRAVAFRETRRCPPHRRRPIEKLSAFVLLSRNISSTSCKDDGCGRAPTRRHFNFDDCNGRRAGARSQSSGRLSRLVQTSDG